MIQAFDKIMSLSLSFLIIVCGLSFGQARLSPDPAVSLIANEDEPLPIEVLVKASLVASGLEKEKMESFSQQIHSIIYQAPPKIDDIATDSDNLLQWMHRELLTQYVEEQTGIHVLLTTGEFNCVSSAVLYMILVRARNTGIYGVVTPDHVFCRIPNENGGVDVETTIPFGYDPGTRKDAIETFVGRTGFVYVPPGNYSRRRNIGEKELISLIYQNRISALQKRNQWEETVGLALDRWILAGTDIAKNDFISALMNVATYADKTYKHREILLVLTKASELLGSEHGLTETATSLLGNAVTRFLIRNQVQEAMEILGDPLATALVPTVFLEKKSQEVTNHVVDNTIKTGTFEESVSILGRYYQERSIDPERWEKLALYLWSKEAQKYSTDGKWLEGWQLLQTANSFFTNIPKWKNLEKTFRHNASITIHNKFVKAFQQKKWNEASRIITEGLALFPLDSNLLKDKSILNSMNIE